MKDADDETLNDRAIGIDLFNRTWDDDAMLHMAHASAHHWRA
jgi:hypothetical protein